VNLLVRTPNWLGDIVMALPAIATIRAHFAGARLTLAAPDGFTPFCAAVPGVDAVLPLPRGSAWRTWRAQRDAIRAGGFDLVILLTNSFGSAWVMAQAGVPERWGYRTDLRGRLLTRAAERPRRASRAGSRSRQRAKTDADALTPSNGDRRVRAVAASPHHSHYYLALTEALGITQAGTVTPVTPIATTSSAAPAPLAAAATPAPSAAPAAGAALTASVAPAGFAPIVIAGELRARAHQLLHERGWAGADALVGVAPGAAYGHAKRWPAESMADVIARLRARGLVPVLLGAAGDRDAARAIESALASRGAAGPLINLVGQTDLPMLMGVLDSCTAVLSNDSGAMHLASAVGRPVVALFGPTNEHATSPLGPHTIVRTDAWCRPCMLRECPIDHRCMRGIAPETVFDHVMTWIQRAAFVPDASTLVAADGGHDSHDTDDTPGAATGARS
jgi:heptosyltransferase-2